MSERSAARAQARFERQDEERLESATLTILDNPDLRWLLWQILEVCNMHENPFHTDALTMAHNAGKMAVGQDIINLLSRQTPDLYPRLMQEFLNEYAARYLAIATRLADTGDRASG